MTPDCMASGAVRALSLDPVMTVAALVRPVPAMAPETPVNRVMDLFSADPTCAAIAVVSDDRPIGLIDRKALIERYAKPYMRELFGKKPLARFMDRAPLVIEMDTDLDGLSGFVLERDARNASEGFIISDRGRYAGIGLWRDLLRMAIEHRQSRLYQLAHYDPLTALPNRLLLQERLVTALAHARRHGRGVAVLFIDLDRFKRVNDTLGHALGDALLKHVAARLTRCVRADDTVARIGGDEFTVILADLADTRFAGRVARKIVDALSAPFFLANQEVFVGASIGVTSWPDDGACDDAEALLKKADTAMYKAKEAGGSVRFYARAMQAVGAQRLSLESDLHKALARGEFVLHYQPQIDLESGEVVAVEALLRWQRPGVGMVMPSDFIALAEECRLISAIGEWVLRAACAQAARWQQAGLPPLRIAVNLSRHQIEQPDLADKVAAVLRETRLAAACLELELTESALMRDKPTAIEQMLKLEALGVTVAMDDFGIGYSSLCCLKRLPLAALKIDRSFIANITADRKDAALTRTMIRMAHDLKLRATAEGVETAAQMAFLRAHGCDQLQGFLFSRPLPAVDVQRLLAKNSRFWPLPA